MSAYLPDLLTGFEARTLLLGSQGDGELCATLVRRTASRKTAGPAILYLHGFCDYFFQDFVAEAFVAAGFSFYALELRRYGRSMRPKNLPNFVYAIDEYFAELTWALETIESEQGGPVLVLAHSTGALTSVLYAKRGSRKDLVQALLLNSPFFEFETKAPLARAGLPALIMAGAHLPKLRLPFTLGDTYGRSLHRSTGGEWDYDLTKKPLGGFPIRAGWLRAVALAQAEVQRGLGLSEPVLVMHSDKSYPPSGPLGPEANSSDAVLDIQDMVRFGRGLGTDVELVTIEGGRHDLFLSSPEPRARAVETAVRFAQGVVDGA